MLGYDWSENLVSDNKKIVCRKTNGIEARIEKAMEDRNRHNDFYYNVLPSIYYNQERDSE